jgi:hypothetical protein
VALLVKAPGSREHLVLTILTACCIAAIVVLTIVIYIAGQVLVR